MAQFEIDIDLCIKDRKPFRVANADKTIRKGVMASCLDELQWLAKQKLDLKGDAKVSLFLEKDGTEVEEQNFFEKLSDHTRFIAKEVSNNDVLQNIIRCRNDNGRFKNVEINRPSSRKIGLKIAGTKC